MAGVSSGWAEATRAAAPAAYAAAKEDEPVATLLASPVRQSPPGTAVVSDEIEGAAILT